MFHLHLGENLTRGWLCGYDGDEYTNDVLGEWFGLYRRDVKIYLLFVNHPVHPV
jgi:hypothetical protein